MKQTVAARIRDPISPETQHHCAKFPSSLYLFARSYGHRGLLLAIKNGLAAI